MRFVRTIPPGLTVTCPDQTHIVVQGCDKQQVGQFAAEVLRGAEAGAIQRQGSAVRKRVREDQAG